MIVYFIGLKTFLFTKFIKFISIIIIIVVVVLVVVVVIIINVSAGVWFHFIGGKRGLFI